MRNRLTSGRISRLAAAAAMLAALPSVVGAWDEDRVQSQIQPYFGGWAGMYMVDKQDMKELIGVGDDFFASALPAAGLSLGVAYGRLHVGVNGGYQLLDGDYSTVKTQNAAKTITYINNQYYYRYQVIPIDLNIDVALLQNESPVNFLLGGSVGLGLVGMQLPYRTITTMVDTANTRYSYYNNDWNYNNFLLATAYAGARINLARRLNLEAQIGYRVLKSSEIELGNGYQLVRTNSLTVADSSGDIVAETHQNIPVSLSSFYLRADIRWTFASQAEKDEDRAAARRKEMSERLAMLPPVRYVD
ncbi:MAG: hypothetical protein RL173_3489 [Fibrobacterota bacterium]|jgi:hypothetical protein